MAHMDAPFPAGLARQIGEVISPARQAYHILHFAFVFVPIIAGLDKFFSYLTNWEMYLSRQVTALLPVSGHDFMLAVGIVEIAAGLLVAFRPRVGGYLVAIWLWAIIANLILTGSYFDIALRDFGLSLGALALARLSSERLMIREPGQVRA
ncbi:MAG: hypothetical protein ACE141_18755 [Bryobacteraceae bacterium]|nr:hypothetical protein [Bryobacterales bacterium]